MRVDPQHCTVRVENEQVRVLRIGYGPPKKSLIYGYPARLAVSLTDASGILTLPDGNTEEIHIQAAQTMWLPAGEHLVRVRFWRRHRSSMAFRTSPPRFRRGRRRS